MFRAIWYVLFGNLESCLEHEWKIVKQEIIEPLKMKYILKLLPKIAPEDTIDTGKVTFITYHCKKCNNFKQKRLVGSVKINGT